MFQAVTIRLTLTDKDVFCGHGKDVTAFQKEWKIIEIRWKQLKGSDRERAIQGSSRKEFQTIQNHLDITAGWSDKHAHNGVRPVMNTYLNLTSLHKHSITVAPPKEWPMTAILHKSIQFCGESAQSTALDCRLKTVPSQSGFLSSSFSLELLKHVEGSSGVRVRNHLQPWPVKCGKQDVLHRLSGVDVKKKIQRSDALICPLFHLKKVTKLQSTKLLYMLCNIFMITY